MFPNDEIQRRVEAIHADVRNRVVIPADQRVMALQDNEMVFLLNLMLRMKPRRTLEVGLGWGYSAAAILAAGSQQHTVIELEQDTPRVTQAAENALAFDNADCLRVLWGSSDEWLPQLVRVGTELDFALIDGGHRFDDAFIDFHYVRQMIRPDGVVLLDDHWMPSIQSLCSWIETNLDSQWQRLHTGAFNYIAFQRTAAPDVREWHHYRPFATDHRNLYQPG